MVILLLKIKETWIIILNRVLFSNETFKASLNFKGLRHLISLSKFWKQTFLLYEEYD